MIYLLLNGLLNNLVILEIWFHYYSSILEINTEIKKVKVWEIVEWMIVCEIVSGGSTHPSVNKSFELTHTVYNSTTNLECIFRTGTKLKIHSGYKLNGTL